MPAGEDPLRSHRRSLAGGCVLALGEANEVLYKSGRNLARTDIRPIHELCAYEVMRRKKLVFTKSAFETLLADPATLGGAKVAQG